MSLDAVLAESRKRGVRALVVPPRFVDFCTWIGVTLHPVQLVFCLVAYDGVQPCELDGVQREIAKVLFGGVSVFTDASRCVVWTLAGGRAGKTYVLGALRLVWGAYVRDLSSMAPGQDAVALCCGPKDIHRQEIINYQLGAIRAHPQLRSTIVAPRGLADESRPERFTIRRPDGHLVRFEGATANRGGYGGRGRALTDFLGDEAAFFLDSKNVVNDAEIFKGASPRILPGGQLIGQTTAYAKLGYHFSQWRENFGHPKAAIAARATTEQLRPDAADMVARERITDPENARREFDAEPMAEAAQVFFSEELIAQCIQHVPWFGTNVHARNPQVEKSAGGDMGFRSNSSALAGTYRVLAALVLAFLDEKRPTDGAPLRPSLTVGSFAATMREHGVSYFMADGHYKESVVEHLGDGFTFVDAPSPAVAAIRARTLMRDGRVVIPDPDHLPPELAEPVRRLIRQLKEVMGRPTSGGGMTIIYPLWPDGSHGDLAVAFVLALYQLAGESAEKPKAKPGTEEWANEEMSRLQEKIRDEALRPAGRR